MWNEILSYLLPILASVLAGLASWAVKLLINKWGLEVDLTRDATTRRLIRAAIFAAEEVAARRLKVEGKGTDKAKLVLDYLVKAFPKMLPEDLARMLDEEIGALPLIGASGKVEK